MLYVQRPDVKAMLFCGSGYQGIGQSHAMGSGVPAFKQTGEAGDFGRDRLDGEQSGQFIQYRQLFVFGSGVQFRHDNRRQNDPARIGFHGTC